MRTELPVFKRCCFCMPLRYGLITWGYFNLIANSIVMVAAVVSLVYSVNMMNRLGSRYNYIRAVVILAIVVFVLLAEIVLNTLFVIAGHLKNVKLLRIYYIYNMVVWGLLIVLFLGLVVIFAAAFVDDPSFSYHAYILMIDLSSYFVNIVMQSYFLLLLRSEIIKLKTNCQFQFSNNAAEAECNMKYREQLLDEEMGTEDHCGVGTCETAVCQTTCQTNSACHKIEDQN